MADYRDNQNEPRRKDETMRSIPLPEGLLRRLKEVALSTDDDLDEAIRRLQVPGRVFSRLKAIPLAENPELIEEAIASVPLPDGFDDRLRMVPCCDDEGMNQVITNVPIPPVVRKTAARVLKAEGVDVPEAVASTRSLSPKEYAQMVLAAGELGMDRLISEVPLPESLQTTLMEVPMESASVSRSATSPPPPPVPVGSNEDYQSDDVRIAASGTVLTEWAEAHSRRQRRARWLGAISTVSVAVLLAFFYYGGYAETLMDRLINGSPSTTGSMIAGSDRLPDEPPEPIIVDTVPTDAVVEHTPTPSPVAPPLVEPESGTTDPPTVAVAPSPVEPTVPEIDSNNMMGGAPNVISPRTEPEEIPRLWPVGIEPPLSPGFDMAFLARSGIHPAIRLTKDTLLDTSTFPLLADTADYEQFRQSVLDGKLPPADTIRPESFLAAIDCGLPTPTDGRPLRLTTSLGPSPINPKAVLMQIGVAAREMSSQPRDPVSLVLAVDVSESMGRHARLAKVRRALTSWIEQGGLRPLDQVTIVAFSDDARIVAERLSAYGTSQLNEAFDSLEVGGSTYLETGIFKALDTADAEAKYFRENADEGFGYDRMTSRVILFTDGTDIYDPQELAALQQRIMKSARSTESPVKLDIINVGGRPSREEGEHTDPTDPLVMLAESSGGRVLRATLVPRISAALQQIITGQDQRVADGVEVRIEINPKTVLAYRLIGHEGGAMTFDSRADFQAGQSAQGVYVLQLRDDVEPSDPIATVDLSWSPTSGGDSQGIRRSIRKSDIATMMYEAPLSFQEAALVVGATEILRDSPFVKQISPRPSLQVILDVARQVDTRLFGRSSFSELMELVEHAAEIKPQRRGR